MKKSDAFIRIMSGFIFLAMIAYLSVYLVNRFLNPVQTALTVTATMTDSSAMSGLVVRDEQLIVSDQQYVELTVSNGEKVGAGQAVAVVYGSEDALERSAQIHALSQEIDDVTAALSNSSGSAMGSENSINNAVLDLSEQIRSGNFLGIETQVGSLSSLLLRADSSDTTEEYLQQLQEEYLSLLTSAVGDTQEIIVQESGTFSNVVDGFESVTPAIAAELTPSSLREIIAEEHTVDADAIGKVVTSFDWYYAAIADDEAVGRLKEGDTVKLSFGRYYSDTLDAEVVSVGQRERGERLVLFRMDRGLDDMLAVRAVSADLVYSEYTGLRIPLKGLFRYYAGYISAEDSEKLSAGETVTLTLGDESYEAVISEIGALSRTGSLPSGVEAGSEYDTRPARRLVIFYWPWEDMPVPDSSAGGGVVTLKNGTSMTVTNYYDYITVDDEGNKTEPEDYLCVFTMTGLQAERKKVTLIYAGEEYALVSSEGSDALREGNEVIVQAKGLYDGKVFQ